MTTPPNYINEKETRALALVVFISCLSFFMTGSILIFGVLLIEFAFRVFTSTEYTPVRVLNNFFLRILKIKPHLIPVAPKKLAAAFGLIFCICILTSEYFDNNLLTQILVGLMAFFSFLEFSMSFCVATLIYNAVVRKPKVLGNNG